MTTEGAWHQELVLPVLLAEGRKTYGKAIRKAYAEAGFDNVPKLGARVLGGIARFGQPTNLGVNLGVSKQAASKVVDTLVVRGYLERRSDESDRRRTVLELTARGEAAAAAGWEASDRVDRQLEAKVGAKAVAQMRKTLGALVELRYEED